MDTTTGHRPSRRAAGPTAREWLTTIFEGCRRELIAQPNGLTPDRLAGIYRTLRDDARKLAHSKDPVDLLAEYATEFAERIERLLQGGAVDDVVLVEPARADKPETKATMRIPLSDWDIAHLDEVVRWLRIGIALARCELRQGPRVSRAEIDSLPRDLRNRARHRTSEAYRLHRQRTQYGQSGVGMEETGT